MRTLLPLLALILGLPLTAWSADGAAGTNEVSSIQQRIEARRFPSVFQQGDCAILGKMA